MGGECEITVPSQMIHRFCDDSDWRKKAILECSKIVFLASPELSVPLPEGEDKKTGIIPDDFEM